MYISMFIPFGTRLASQRHPSLRSEAKSSLQGGEAA